MATCNSFKDWNRYTQKVIAEEGIANKKQILHIIQINVRSLKKHWDELNVYLLNPLLDVDIIILTEINIEAEEPLPFHIAGFHSISVRRKSRKGVGF